VFAFLTYTGETQVNPRESRYLYTCDDAIGIIQSLLFGCAVQSGSACHADDEADDD
jgi:hypothetical protein